MLDSVVAAETPEGILLELRPAGISARCCAYLIDQLIRIAILYAAAFILMFFGGLGWAFWAILSFLLEWFYPVLFEVLRDGATPENAPWDSRSSWTMVCRSRRLPR